MLGQHIHRVVRIRLPFRIRIELRIQKWWFLSRGENRSIRRKTFWNKGENQQQTEFTYVVAPGIRHWAIMMGHKCSYQSPISLIPNYLSEL